MQLTHLPTGIVVKSQATRSRSQNYKIARQILAEKIEHLEKGDESRFAKKVERISTKKRSKEKKARRKYRALDEANRGEVEEVDGGKELNEMAVQNEAGGRLADREETRKQKDKKT